jgi:hypothetical protein
MHFEWQAVIMIIDFNLLQDYLFVGGFAFLLGGEGGGRAFSYSFDVDAGEGEGHDFFGLEVAEGQE